MHPALRLEASQTLRVRRVSGCSGATLDTTATAATATATDTTVTAAFTSVTAAVASTRLSETRIVRIQ